MAISYCIYYVSLYMVQALKNYSIVLTVLYCNTGMYVLYSLSQYLSVVYFVKFSLTIMILTKMNCYVGRFIE